MFALALAATAGLYLLTSRHEGQDLHWATRIATESFRADIIADVEFEITGLIRLSMLAEEIGPDERFWRENVDLYMQRRPGCLAVELLTLDYQQRSVIYAPGLQHDTPLAPVPVDVLKYAAESARPAISPSVVVNGTRSQRTMVVPIDSDGEPAGFVVAFFDVAKSFEGILADVTNLGFTLSILEQGREQYRTAGAGKGNDSLPSLVETAKVTFPAVTWDLRVWPQAATLFAMNAHLPELTLIVGVLISLLLASTVHFACSAAVQSRHLRTINTALLEEIREHEQAKDALHRAQDHLETRVRQRTSDLATANEKLEHEIMQHAQAEESLRVLTGQLFHLQDEERRRLARELHDGATQNLIALAMNMASVRNRGLSPEQRNELLDDSVQLIQQSVGELRTLSHLLHPPLIEELGLPATLRSYVEGFSSRSGIRVEVLLDPDLGRLDPDVEIGIFRVVQESLANVHRHSHSSTASVMLCREQANIRLEVSDAGTGIPPDALSGTECGLAGVGVAGMRERVRLLGGRFELVSGNTGTTVRILLPEAKPADLLSVSAPTK